MPHALPRPFASLSRLLAPVCAVAVALLAGGCADDRTPDGRVRVVYWEKWTGAEAADMRALIDSFNASQERIKVELLSVSGIDRKTMLATAGGDPPDIAGVWIQQIASWADRNALTPLDSFIEADGMTRDEFLGRYEDVFARMCQYEGRVYCVPATPATIALHWNRTLFREAGLDPDRPPRTIEELVEFSRRLTKRDPRSGALTQVGFLPQDPGWWAWAWPRWFGGELLDAEGAITYATDPANVASMQWVRGFTEFYGLEPLTTFATGFGQFGSPQYPFFAGKVGMVFQGVWFHNYMRQYAPGLDYGVAPWPLVHEGEAPYTIAEADMLVIPRGAKHAREAWEFLKYVASNNPEARTREELRGVELLCHRQGKSSPLRQWSPYFTAHHPHPHIHVFRELARSPRADFVPKMGMWQEYIREINVAFDKVRFLRASPQEAMDYAQQRIEASWREHRRSLDRQHLAAARRDRDDPPAHP